MSADRAWYTSTALGRRITIRLLILAALTVWGCARFVVEPQTLSGTFTGAMPDGRPIVVTVEQAGQVFRGEGSVDGEPLVLAGPLVSSAVGSLAFSDGAFASAHVRLSGGGDVLTIARVGQPDIVLNRGGTPVQSPPGPFSGRYRALEAGMVLAETTLVQSGLLVSGVGIIAGGPAGINGRVMAPRKLTGIITFRDESQVRFEAELSADAQTIEFRGFGRPINLQRR